MANGGIGSRGRRLQGPGAGLSPGRAGGGSGPGGLYMPGRDFSSVPAMQVGADGTITNIGGGSGGGGGGTEPVTGAQDYTVLSTIESGTGPFTYEITASGTPYALIVIATGYGQTGTAPVLTNVTYSGVGSDMGNPFGTTGGDIEVRSQIVWVEAVPGGTNTLSFDRSADTGPSYIACFFIGDIGTNLTRGLSGRLLFQSPDDENPSMNRDIAQGSFIVVGLQRRREDQWPPESQTHESLRSVTDWDRNSGNLATDWINTNFAFRADMDAELAQEVAYTFLNPTGESGWTAQLAAVQFDPV